MRTTLALFWILTPTVPMVALAETATINTGVFYDLRDGSTLTPPMTLVLDGERLTINGIPLVVPPPSTEPPQQKDSPFLRETNAVLDRGYAVEARLQAAGKAPYEIYEAVLATLAASTTIVEEVVPKDERTIIVRWKARDDPFFYPSYHFQLSDRAAVQESASPARKLFDEFSAALRKDGIVAFFKPSLKASGDAQVRQQIAPCLDALLATRQPPDPESDCARSIGGIATRFLNPPAQDAGQ